MLSTALSLFISIIPLFPLLFHLITFKVLKYPLPKKKETLLKTEGQTLSFEQSFKEGRENLGLESLLPPQMVIPGEGWALGL